MSWRAPVLSLQKMLVCPRGRGAPRPSEPRLICLTAFSTALRGPGPPGARRARRRRRRLLSHVFSSVVLCFNCDSSICSGSVPGVCSPGSTRRSVSPPPHRTRDVSARTTNRNGGREHPCPRPSNTMIVNNGMDLKVCVPSPCDHVIHTDVSLNGCHVFLSSVLVTATGSGCYVWDSWEDCVFGLNECVDTKKCVIH